MKQEPENDSYFLCKRSRAGALIAQAERERDQILKEFEVFYSGDIGIRIYAVEHVMGASIAGDLTVNGEVCRQYDPIDLCFLDLLTLMMKRLIDVGVVPA